MQDEYIIRINNLTKIYDGKTVVDNINLNIKKGEFVTLLGPSGCGKTTTLRMIAGFENPDSGTILFDGEDIAGLPPYRRPVNTVFQKYALFPHLNVFNNIAFGLKLKKVEAPVKKQKNEQTDDGTKIADKSKLINLSDYPVTKKYVGKDGVDREKTVKFKRLKEYEWITVKGVKKRKKVNQYKKFIDQKVRRALKIVGLSDYELRDVNSLSGGQQQRVAIARAIVNEPKVLLLDEPLGALDLKMRQEMQLELKAMHRELGITFIYVTHDQEEALTMSDTIVVMRDGKICQEGSPMDIYNEPATAYVADFIGESNILDGVMSADRDVVMLGAHFECVDEGFEPNQPVDVVIRPEDLVIKPESDGTIVGEITSTMFRGVHYEMTCVSNGFELIIHNTVERPVGSRVGLYVEPENIQIMNKERYSNVFEAEFASNTTLKFCGALYDADPTLLFEDCEYDADDDEVKIGLSSHPLKGETIMLSVDFTAVDMADNGEDAPLAGNVESMIYKGKNYLVAIKTDDDRHFYADTEYLWDVGDRVGIIIPKTAFKRAKEGDNVTI